MSYFAETERARRLTDDEPRLYEGTIVATPDPGDGIEVVLPGYDPDHSYGPMPYAPRSDSLPTRGMACLVAISSASDFWCVQWWPGAAADAEVLAGVRSGHGSPSAGQGRDGDYYVNIDNNDLYGPKSGTWGSPTNLVGPVGPAGPAGSKGDKGEKGDPGPNNSPNWYNLPLAPSVTFYGGLFDLPRYSKDDAGWVVVEGLVAYTAGSYISWILATLPLGFRPKRTKIFNCTGSYSGGPLGFRVDVQGDGIIIGQQTSGVPWTGGYQSLDGIRFEAGT